nr:MAG TPA: hypothetical protein [Caudoviricetes sp.]
MELNRVTNRIIAKIKNPPCSTGPRTERKITYTGCR